MGKSQERCPICGAPKSKQVKKMETECTKCKFPYAFVEHFASKQSFEKWKAKIEEENEKVIYNLQYRCRRTQSFLLFHDGLSYLSPYEHVLSLIKEHTETAEENVKQFDASERNNVWLMRDGNVFVSGDNTYNQLDAGDWKKIQYVCAAPGCIYGIREDETIVGAGSVFNQEIKNWSNIVKIVCGNYHLVGLKKDGTVCASGNMLDPETKKEVESWSRIMDIASAGDCILGLTENGKVRFAGRETDSRKEVSKWSDIIAIAVDSVYVFGLTAKGTILMSGECKSSFLDMGRKDAKNWENIVEITCCRSGVAAIEKDGTLHLAGNIQGKNEIQKKYMKKYKERVTEDFINYLIK